MEEFENISAEAKKFRAAAIARSSQRIRNGLIDPARRLSHYHDAIAHVNGFVDVMGDKEHGGTACLPEPQHFILHPHASKGVERAERFVEQENFRVVDERSRESNALGHAPGKMVRISVAKSFKADEAHEFVHFISLLTQHSTRYKTNLDVATNGEPGKQIWVLKDETTFRAWFADWFRADQKVP
jgi:hypothetical protein